MSCSFPSDVSLHPAKAALSEQKKRLRNWNKRSKGNDLSKIKDRAVELSQIMKMSDYIHELEQRCLQLAEGHQAAYDMGYAAGFGTASRSKLDEIASLNQIMLSLATKAA